jgi:hypothetical protein
MGDTLAIMFTFTTYGTWLRGDQRGWVDDGVIMPPDPILEEADRRRMKHPPFRFSPHQFLEVGVMIGASLCQRMAAHLWAMTIQTWHVHFVTAATGRPAHQIAKCAKDAVCWGLRPGRPIWADDFDKRFCFDVEAVRRRIDYVERHNLAIGLPARPWPLIESPGF